MLLALIGGSLAVVPHVQADTEANRAAASFQAMQQAFADRSGRYRETIGSPALAHAWPYSQALAAAISVARKPHAQRAYAAAAQRALANLKTYLGRNGAYVAGAGPSGDVYYDDNEWIALDLLRWYHMTRKLPALARTRQLFTLVARAWDGDETHSCPGGVFWTTAPGNDDRNTVTTATGALLAMGLYEDTHYVTYLTWARKMLDWVATCMRGPDGLLWDHLTPAGTLDERHWSYNQGTAIGALVVLYRLTGDQSALAQARQLADQSLAYFDLTATSSEPPFFFAIFFRNLMLLNAATGDVRYRNAVESYADAVWAHLRDGRGLFHFADSPWPTLLEQAAMVQIYASLAEGATTTDP